MSRAARKKSKTGIYHIIMRGINRQSIFEDEEDRERLLLTLERYKATCGYSIYAYCLMDNHLHILIKEEKELLAQTIRRIAGSYVYWYNRKYERIGNLFQDRFKSEPVENDSYFLTVLRYIHQNPVKAGIMRNIKEYKWSSYDEYIGESKIIDKEYTLKMFDENNNTAIKAFIKFNNEYNDDKCLEIEEKKRRMTDQELREIIKGKEARGRGYCFLFRHS